MEDVKLVPATRAERRPASPSAASDARQGAFDAAVDEAGSQPQRTPTSDPIPPRAGAEAPARPQGAAPWTGADEAQGSEPAALIVPNPYLSMQPVPAAPGLHQAGAAAATAGGELPADGATLPAGAIQPAGAQVPPPAIPGAPSSPVPTPDAVAATASDAAAGATPLPQPERPAPQAGRIQAGRPAAVPDAPRADAESAGAAAAKAAAGAPEKTGAGAIKAMVPETGTQREPGRDTAAEASGPLAGPARPSIPQGAEATATTFRAAAPGPAPHPSEQFREQVVRVLVAGKNEFRIELTPPELGRVHVKAAMDDGAVGLVIQVDRAETLDLLRRDLPALQRALGEAGMRLDTGNLQFQLRGDDAPRGSGLPFADRDGTAGQNRRHWDDPTAEEARAPREIAVATAEGVLDVLV
ncbi:flagellar hook-length control protein FliK [Arenibaculum pallidiluteum]|uniref:flagellar hook-length control protein FliK n=1 Tax=Arenibaculum pallidiluteum TaxID=2812559 RepID=UPI001A95D707|nr:flagellar hook-length control protein FliK [Arenibaculum pallidiluteum]